MSLMRAFTTRHKKAADIEITSPMHIGRAASHRAGRPVIRTQISSPVALVSTSNVLLNNAENIAGTHPIDMRSVSSGSSVTSGDDSDTSSGDRTLGTVTDASSIDESPIEAEPNHLSCYFKPAIDTETKSPSLSRSPSSSARPSLDTPRIPQRVPSHSKKAHESLHRKNSIKRIMSPPPNRDSARSADLRSPTMSAFVEAPKESPFGAELAKLDEVAEEFGHVVCDAEADADLSAMQTHDLAYFAASDYLSEIHSLIYATFSAEQNFASWI